MMTGEGQVTPEHVYLSRREVLKRAGFLLAGALVSSSCDWSKPEATSQLGSTAGMAPTQNPGDYTSFTDEFGDALTPLGKIRAWGNYYEFTRANQGIGELAKDLQTSPWQVEVGGLVRNPQAFDLDALREFGLEEVVYRLRCIEAWSMVIPWLGFPLNRLLAVVEPAPEARFVRFTCLYDPSQMPGQDPAHYEEWLQSHDPTKPLGIGAMGGNEDSPYVWPYVEGLRLDEAMHDLTLIALGMYGKPLPPENGAPVRLVVPWKYGFKGVKALAKIDLVAEQPATFWNTVLPDEYGFWANVNPDVPHPRWSQGREFRLMGQDPEPVLPTLPFNGYAEQVAHLYEGMDLKANF